MLSIHTVAQHFFCSFQQYFLGHLIFICSLQKQLAIQQETDYYIKMEVGSSPDLGLNRNIKISATL